MIFCHHGSSRCAKGARHTKTEAFFYLISLCLRGLCGSFFSLNLESQCHLLAQLGRTERRFAEAVRQRGLSALSAVNSFTENAPAVPSAERRIWLSAPERMRRCCRRKASLACASS